MLIQTNLTLEKKLEILSDAAKYDVACTSSGVDRRGKVGTMGNAAACGICHTFSADGRCVSLLKILMTNACIYDCRYCINRVTNDTLRTAFTPDEICQLTLEFYRRNYIEGLFLSSGILNSPDETMELICDTLELLRTKYRFNGYIHIKAIPGADPSLIERAGLLTDRMSINLELPTGEGLRKLAPAKTREKILNPMRQVQRGIAESREMIALTKKPRRVRTNPNSNDLFYLPDSRMIPNTVPPKKETTDSDILLPKIEKPASVPSSKLNLSPGQSFVPAGQSTQMIIGATPETDQQILKVTEALYQRFSLKRVFFSAYTALNEDSRLPDPDTPPPLLREHRLYQADWLLRFYGFQAGELLSDANPNFSLTMDPKCDWAIQHLDRFPMDVSTASYADLLRIPGIGVKSARRIVMARRYGTLDYDALKKMGVVLKRAGFFILCEGKPLHPLKFEADYLKSELSSVERNNRLRIENQNSTYRQMSLFDDFHLSGTTTS